MKRIIAFFTVCILALAGCNSNSKSVSFKLNDERFETLYDDSYFLLDNKEYHQEIAYASLASAMATVNNKKEDYSVRSANLVDLWKSEDFSNIYISDAYKVKPTLDSVGYGIASKRIGDFNLVAIALRSGAYEAEWASNFTVGDEGNAAGFQNSANLVLEGLKEYVATYGVKGHTKFWISGYSRGGGVANLLAGTILKSIESGTFLEGVTSTKEDIYAYCFEPPSGANLPLKTVRSELYYGIHNVVNFNDVVPMVYPSTWEFYRFGQNHYYPDRITDINFDAKARRIMVGDYHFADNAKDHPKYRVDEWKFYDPGKEEAEWTNCPRESLHPSLGRFAQNLIKTLTYILGRYIWSGQEEGVRNIFATIHGYNPDVEGISISPSVFFDLLFSYSFLQTLFSEIIEKDYMAFVEDLEYAFLLLFNANSKNFEAIHKLYEDIFYLLLYAVPTLSMRPDIVHQLFSRDNLLMLTSTHLAELNYPFLKSCDTRFHGEEACQLNDGSYYILHISEPTSISIYEKTLEKNVFSYQDGKMSSDTLSAEKFANGDIDIYMPKNGQYEYDIQAEEIFLINVDEYNNETLVDESMPASGTF